MRILKKTILFFLIRIVCVCLSFFFCCHSLAQETKKTIRGTIIDSLENIPLDSCTVTFQSGGKKIHSLSNPKGNFSVQHSFLSDTILISFNHAGYQGQQLTIVDTSRQIDMGRIYIVPLTKMMDSIVIKNHVPAIVVRNDTTEFTVDSFGLRKGDMVGDILKLLPGLEMDDNGNFLFNGKPVNRILVDGEDFFGGDREMMLGKIPADIVSRIQLMDTRTRDDVLNELQSDGEHKTLNIKLKPGLKVFGNASAMAGTSNQFRGDAMANVLNNNNHIGINANANSVNKMRFNKIDPGVASVSRSIGTYFRSTIGKKVFVNGNLLYGSNGNSQESRSQLQQYITADSFFISNSRNVFDTKGGNSNAQITVRADMDTMSSITANISYSAGKNSSTGFSTVSTSEKGKLKNESVRNNSTESEMRNFSADLSFSKRFKKRGRSMSLNLRNSFGNNNSDMLNISDNYFYKDSQPSSQDLLRQHILTKGQNQSVGIGFTYLEPITKQIRVQVGANFDLDRSTNQRRTFNIDSITHQDKYDSLYSNEWSSQNSNKRANLSFIYNGKKLYISTGVVGYMNEAERTMEDNETISRHVLNYSPVITSTFQFTKRKSLRFNFSANNINPGIEQLQPVPDNSNPLYIRLGNPGLRSSFSQNYNLSYSTSDSIRMASVSLGYSPVANSIVNAVYYDEFRKRTSQYINVDGVYNMRANWNFSTTNPFSGQTARWGLSGNAGFGRNVFFDNSEMLYTRNYNIRQTLSYTKIPKAKRRGRFTGNISLTYSRTVSPADKAGINSRNLAIGPRMDWEYSFKKLGQMRTSYSMNYSQMDYNASVQQKTKYVDQNLNYNIDLNITEKLSVGSDFSYRYTNRTALGNRRSTYLWNLSASMEVFSRGSLNFSAVDILNSNTGIMRSIGETYIQDTQIARLRNYYTLSFNYNWSKIDKKKSRGNNRR